MKLILLFLLSLNIYASVQQDMLGLYQNKKYEDACNIGFDNFGRFKRDEDFLSLYAFSCLEADYIDRLALPIAMLKSSNEARANSAYLSIIFMQKKLLYHALVDNYKLAELRLPTTEHIISKVFDMYAKLGKHEKRMLYIFDDSKNAKVSYKLYLEQDYRIPKMIIEEYYDALLVKRHIYW